MEDSRVCPICETENAADAAHCEVCGESLAGDADAQEFGSTGAAVVGFAVEDSGGSEGDLEFVSEVAPDQDGADDIGDEPPAVEASEADVTDEEMMTAAPADDTAAMDAVDASQELADDGSQSDDAGADDEIEELDADMLESEAVEDVDGALEEPTGEGDEDADGVSAADYDETPEGDGESFDDHEDVEATPDDYDEAIEDAADEADEFDDSPAEPEFLYSPMDGTAYPRGSAEYEEGFGPNGEELVATAPDVEPADDYPDIEDDPAPSLAEPSGATMDDSELAAVAAPSAAVSAEFQAAFKARERRQPTMRPLPQPGSFVDPATVTVYANREPVMRLLIETDEVLIGRRDPVADAYPDLDLTDLDPEAHISRKHAYIYRQNKNYTLYAVSNAGTQLNSDLLDLGDRRPLADGDVIVLAGKIAMKFEMPNA